MIRTDGNQWKIDGERRPYRGQSWFKWGSLVKTDEGKARAALQRAKALGMDLIRVFDEHHDWKGSKFLSHGAPLYMPWNLNQATNSSFSMSPGHKAMHERMAKLLEEEGMHMELVINTTLKSQPGVLAEDYKNAASYWERMNRVVMQHWREIGSDRVIFENCNEFEAHVGRKLYNYMREDDKGVDLIQRMAGRARVDNPGRPYGISHGGRWSPIEYKVGYAGDRYSHLNVHSARHGNEWYQITPNLAKLNAVFGDFARALNENMHGMSRTQWAYWVDQANHPAPDKLRNQSRPDTKDNVNFMQAQWKQAFAAGWGYVLHNANGVFSDPDAPLDGFEKAWAAEFGGGPPPPPPDPPRPYDRFVKDKYLYVLKRDADEDGLDYYSTQMEKGATLQQVENTLMRSSEYMNNPELWRGE